MAKIRNLVTGQLGSSRSMLIFCNGMIRSGSTLQYNLVRSLVEETGSGKAEGYIHAEELPVFAPRLRRWAKEREVHVVKTHAHSAIPEDLLSAESVRVCYIYRDLRSVARSVKRVWNHHGAQLIATLDEAVGNCAAVEALEGDVLIQRYEDVVDSLVEATARLAQFLRLPESTALIEEVARSCSSAEALRDIKRHHSSVRHKLVTVARKSGTIAIAKRVLESLSVPELIRVRLRRMVSPYDLRTLLHDRHILDDVASAEQPHAAELSDEEIALITARYSDWLRSKGYLA